MFSWFDPIFGFRKVYLILSSSSFPYIACHQHQTNQTFNKPTNLLSPLAISFKMAESPPTTSRRRVRRRLSAGSHDGITDLSGVLAIHTSGVYKLLEAAESAGIAGHIREKLEKLLGEKHIALSSSFSGLLTAEKAQMDVIKEIAKALQLPAPKITLYSATECDRVVIETIGHSSLKPLHQFIDVKDRLHDVDRMRLQDKLQAYLDEWDSLVFDYKWGSSGFSKDDMTERKDDMAMRLIHDFCTDMNQIEFRNEVPCENHSDNGGLCPVSPYQFFHSDDLVWIESAGTECRPFSQLNQKREGWISMKSLDTFTWIFSTRYYNPSKAIHECVKKFDRDLLLYCFNMDIGRQLKSVYAPSPIVDEKPWTMIVQVFCPSQVGVLAHRMRGYATLSSPTEDGDADGVHARDFGFFKAFGDSLKCDLSIYFTGTSFEAEDDERSITPRMQNDIDNYFVTAFNRGWVDECNNWLESSHPMIVDLSHTSKFFGAAREEVWPIVTRNSIFLIL